jgi:DNA polymerase-3 subunit epsilon
MALSKPRQCLLVRFINRKSIFVKAKSYTYEEIEDIPDNLDFLFQQDWFIPLQSKNIVAFANHLSKHEIIQVIDELNATRLIENPVLVYKKSQAKATLVACILDSAKVNDVQKTTVAES